MATFALALKKKTHHNPTNRKSLSDLNVVDEAWLFSPSKG